jgi:superfamily II DNA or RNA helicase
MAWSSGGRTVKSNLQALCVACNRRKGVREGRFTEATFTTVAPASEPLRSWQEVAWSVVQDAKEPVLIEACPGSGKTRFALECAARMFRDRKVNRVLVVVPTSRLVDQWVSCSRGTGGGAVVPLAPAGWRPTEPLTPSGTFRAS